MSKLRIDYEKTIWRRIYHFIEGDDPEDIYPSGYEDEKSAFERREQEHFFRQTLYDHKKKETEAIIDTQKEWPKEKGTKLFSALYRFSVVLMGITIILVLLATVSYLPHFGDASNPVNNEVYERYINKGVEETGAVNIVSGVILDYRAFDTLGESHVLFVACCCVLILLRIDPATGTKQKSDDLSLASDELDKLYEPKSDSILQHCAKILVPIIILFGIYIILNGHLSPGGGFSGGAIIGAGLILYLNAFGFARTEKFMNYKTFQRISVSALLFYSLSKSYSFFTGANHLPSIIHTGIPGKIISAGLILPLNICVGMVVACTMYCFYTMFRKGGM